MATKINPRWLRKGRVLYNKGSSPATFAYLLQTPAPGEWRVLYSSGLVQRRATKNLAAEFDGILMTIGSVPNVELETLDTMMEVVDKAIDSGTPFMNEFKAAKAGLVSAKARIGRGVSAAAVATATASAPVSRASAKFEVAPYDPESYWYESDDDAALFEDFITMRKNSHPVNLLIAGPSGSGKTEGIGRLGKRLGIPVHIVNCQAITTPEKWIGQMMADVETGTHFEPSQHIQWVERSHEDCEGFDFCIILYDEITRLRPELNNMTYSLFDTQKGLEVPQMGRRVHMAQENMVIATANLGAAFTGTHTQDRAFRERFSLTVERNFPPDVAEVKILTSSTGVSGDNARQLVRVANQSRGLWERDELDSPISTRTLKAWALLVAGGYAVKKAAEYTVIPLYSNDGGLASDRTKIASMIEGKVV